MNLQQFVANLEGIETHVVGSFSAGSLSFVANLEGIETSGNTLWDIGKYYVCSQPIRN